MVAPVIWGGVVVAGVATTAWAVKEAGDAADAGTRLIKWGTAAGGLYVSYRAMRSAGVLK